ncbi:hypothetical protein EJ02DRAFT_466751 [Clathrospora elynae]|uniref:NB-ARC domain-containing protein n=1 Tax=Clathrospora elynae TaxID=706981 RepID=A0A6A5SM08_9PLEO|nr:hypothetical protein EJ02DRAFT_466751 [Clathrospora elynae]
MHQVSARLGRRLDFHMTGTFRLGSAAVGLNNKTTSTSSAVVRIYLVEFIVNIIGTQINYNYPLGKLALLSLCNALRLTASFPTARPETPSSPSCTVPFRRDPDFVDRGPLLDQIRKQCSVPASRVALVGLGGVGKSQLAIEHCYRTAEQLPETWVFWANASNTARLEQSYQEIADQVKACGRKDPQADLFKLVHDWLHNEKNGPWRLVLDNADDAAVPSPPPSNNQKTQADDGGNGGSGALRQHLSRLWKTIIASEGSFSAAE